MLNNQIIHEVLVMEHKPVQCLWPEACPVACYNAPTPLFHTHTRTHTNNPLCWGTCGRDIEVLLGQITEPWEVCFVALPPLKWISVWVCVRCWLFVGCQLSFNFVGGNLLEFFFLLWLRLPLDAPAQLDQSVVWFFSAGRDSGSVKALFFICSILSWSV